MFTVTSAFEESIHPETQSLRDFNAGGAPLFANGFRIVGRREPAKSGRAAVGSGPGGFPGTGAGPRSRVRSGECSLTIIKFWWRRMRLRTALYFDCKRLNKKTFQGSYSPQQNSPNGTKPGKAIIQSHGDLDKFERV